MRLFKGDKVRYIDMGKRGKNIFGVVTETNEGCRYYTVLWDNNRNPNGGPIYGYDENQLEFVPDITLTVEIL